MRLPMPFALLVSLLAATAPLATATAEPIASTEKFVETFGIDGVFSCTSRSVEIAGPDPVNLKMRTVFTKVYALTQVRESEDLKTIIIVPPTGGVTKLDLAYASALCFSGFRVLILEGWENDREIAIDLGLHDRAAKRSLAAVHDVLRYLSPRRKTQTGILGTSLGAIIAAVASQTETQIGAAALIVGGGDLAGIIAESEQKDLVRLRDERMRQLGFRDRAEYRLALNGAISIEPLEYFRNGSRTPIWMMVATKDRVVPTTNQSDLALSIGPQLEFNEYAGDHLETIVQTFLKRSQDITDFFNRTLH